MFHDEHLYSIALRQCNMIGDINFSKLIQLEGSAQNVWKQKPKTLTKLYGIGTKTIADIGNEHHLKFAEKEIEFCIKNKVGILLKQKQELPFCLSECEDAPNILYIKGKIDSQKTPISIVGTRNITAYGKQFIKDLLENLPKNIVTISGLALGTDSEVHLRSLDENIPTISVLAHGLHTLYPAKNKKLSERILENNGALISEFNSSQKPDREHFIQRNRIIAGMSSATIVVETAYGGGSISTASFANQYNRDVYALPGKITDKYSQGCNHLIVNNKAAAISNIKDLIERLNLSQDGIFMPELFPKDKDLSILNNPQKQIYQIIEHNPKINLDELSIQSNISTSELLSCLLEMEILGFVKPLSGKQFCIN